MQLVRALWAPGPATYTGRYYGVTGADCQPKPPSGRVPLIIGGNGERRTLPLAVRYADEWNAFNLAPDTYAQKAAALSRHHETAGRDPRSLRRSMMVFGLIGPTAREIEQSTRRVQSLLSPGSHESLTSFQDEARRRGFIVGTTDEVLDTLGRLADLGVQEVQFQHLFFDRDDIPEYLAAEIAPAVADF